MALRITRDTERGERCDFSFDGAAVDAYHGETVAAALLASGRRTFRLDSLHQPRGPYCNMGTCFECVVEVRAGALQEWRAVRACLTPVAAHLEVRSLK